ncbi:MAG: Coenzyme F420 hydrogenase/dehydrogenase, beta subunit C-terminal domain, partial [Candidatus Thorarchaeota archaeon]|nr:Coenzyme F420 hydrogenase/dehydrogenase, beta subunit C-terminal domain [Candidatus Thorarchaeota archaeon]
MTDIEKTLVTSQEWLKENTKRYAFKKLEREVIGTGACVECGTCVSNCPVDAITVTRVDGKYIPELTGKCISCGICYAMCPRSLSLPKDLIGEYISIHKARSLIQHVRRQDGGVVTAILTALIRAKEIDAAIVAMHSNEAWLPDSVIATTEDQILESGGTFYTHAPIVEGMMRAFDEGYSKLAVVGTSCNINAISRLQTHPAGFLYLSQDANVLKIGLFCMESFNHEGLKRFLLENGIDISAVTRMAIAGGKFMVTTSNIERHWPVADLNSIASRSCSYCHDLTSTSADISCGNIGSE